MRGALFFSELRIHLAQRSLWLGLPAVAAFGAVLTNGIQVEQDLAITSSYHLLNLHVVMLMMSLPFIVGVLGMTAFLRDSQHRFLELSYSTPVSSMRFLVGRYVAFVAVTLLVLVAAQLGITAGLVMKSVQPVAILSLVRDLAWMSLVVMLPAVLLYCALYMLLGTFTRNAVALHFSMLVVFMLYMLAATGSGSPVLVNPGLPNPLLVTLMLWLDPFAMAPVAVQAEQLTIAARNSVSIAMDGPLLLNRLAVLALAAFALGVALQRFRLRLPAPRRRQSEPATAKRAVAPMSLYATAAVRNGRGAQWRAFLSLCRIEYRTTIKSHLFLLVVVTWALLIGGEVYSGLTWLEPMATRVPGTADALNRFQWDIVPQFGMLILLLLASEIVWRDRALGISSIVAPTPVGNIALLASKWFSLVLIIATLLAVAVILALVSQLLHGSPIDWAMYAAFFAHAGIPLVCVGTLCLAVNAISPGRISGIAVTAFVLALALTPLGYKLGLEHPLLRFAQSPLQPWSDLVEHAGTESGFRGYMLLWLAVSALLMIIAYGVYHRGLAGRRAVRGLARHPAWLVAASMAMTLTVMSGWHVERQLRRDAHFLTSDEQAAWKAAYEKKYGYLRDRPSPAILHAAYDVNVFPEERRLSVSGDYTLHNPHAMPLDQALVNTHIGTRTDAVTLEGAELVEHDAQLGQYRFALQPLMQPGETRSLRFETVIEQSGYGVPPTHALVMPGYSYLRAIPYLPYVGYVEEQELADNTLRASAGLAKRPEPPTLSEAIAMTGGDFRAGYDWVTVDTTISTTAGETAIAQGQLLDSYEANGRRTFQYRTTAPIRNIVAFHAGALEMRSRKIGGITLELYFKRGHERNVEHMLDAMADAVLYLQEAVGPYPYPQLRLVESPLPALTGYALPQTVMIGEDVGFKADLDDTGSFDHVYRRAVHEVAHQWFGHGIGNGVSADGAFLVESLAKYVELVLLQRKHGTESVKRLVSYELGRYNGGRGRAVNEEQPLALATDTHVVYAKASVVFYRLLEAVGEETINRTLSVLWRKHYYPDPPATSLDFVDELKRHTDPQHHELLDDLLLRGDSQHIPDDEDLSESPAQT